MGSIPRISNRVSSVLPKFPGLSLTSILNLSWHIASDMAGVRMLGVSGVLCKKVESLSIGGNLTFNLESDSKEVSSSSRPSPLGVTDAIHGIPLFISSLAWGSNSAACWSVLSVHWIGTEHCVSAGRGIQGNSHTPITENTKLKQLSQRTIVFLLVSLPTEDNRYFYVHSHLPRG